MTDSLWISGPMPGMNEIIGAAKGAGGRGTMYSLMKRQWTDHVWAFAKGANLPLREGPVSLHFEWHEPTRKRDPDNVACAKKFILDGLVKAGVLPGDGWAHIGGWTDAWLVDKKNPGCLVTIADVRPSTGEQPPGTTPAVGCSSRP